MRNIAGRVPVAGAGLKYPWGGLVLCAIALFMAAPASAETILYLVDTPFAPPAATKIYAVSPATGEMSVAADLGDTMSPFFGLAAASESVVYATATDPGGTICPTGGCQLVRIVLDPDSTTPVESTVIGTIQAEGSILDKITGLTFNSNGDLYAICQDDDGLYIIDTATASAQLVGIVDIDLHGGDITFDSQGRLLMWTNLNSQSGLYEINPITAEASVFQLEPGIYMAGLAALAHSDLLYGSSPPLDNLLEFESNTGPTGVTLTLTLDGNTFDHKRGDLDSPYCLDDLSCDDGNICTSPGCRPGGCAYTPISIGQETCGIGACSRTVERCMDGTLQSCTPGIPATESCDGLDNDCDGIPDNNIAVPQAVSGLTIGVGGASQQLAWQAAGGADSYAILRGDAAVLHASGGQFSDAVDTCLSEQTANTTLVDTDEPVSGQIFWYLVKGSNCAGSSPADSQGPGQAAARDAQLAGFNCP